MENKHTAVTGKCLLVAMVLGLTACAPPDPSRINIPLDALSAPTPEQRFKVVRVGTFADDLAYSDERGIYIITDQETDQQYVGVSGIGISELGHHGKGQEDER